MWHQKRLLFSKGMLTAMVVGVMVADQVSKWWAVGTLTHAFSTGTPVELAFGDKLARFLWERHPMRKGVVSVWDDFWHFRYVENPGAAWGFLSGSASSFRTPFFLLVSVVAVVCILGYMRRTVPQQVLLRLGLALILGGALGNFVDRLRLGYVIDFIDWHWYDTLAWPTFNIADVAISVGVFVLLLDMFVYKMHPSPERATQVRRRSGYP